MTKLKEHSREICYMVIWCYSQCLLILSTMSWVRGIFLRASTIFSAVASSPTEDFHISISCRAWIETLIGNSLYLTALPLNLPLCPGCLRAIFQSHRQCQACGPNSIQNLHDIFHFISVSVCFSVFGPFLVILTPLFWLFVWKIISFKCLEVLNKEG